MSRRGERDAGKERFWRSMVQQWRRSGQTARAFCAAHRLSEPSFYAWRRTIAERDEQAQRNERHAPVMASRDDRQGMASARPPAFVPVQVTPSSAAAGLEVVLGAGCVVRVPSGFDAATLRQLLAVLAEASSC